MLRVFEGYDTWPASAVSFAEANAWTPSFNSFSTGTDTAFGYGRWAAANGNRYMGSRYTTQTFTVGLRCYISESLTISFRDSQLVSSGTNLVSLSFDTNGTITLATTQGGTLARTPAQSFTPFKWFWLEIQCKIGSAGTGTLEVRVNTATKLSFPSITTSAAAAPIGGLAAGADLINFNNTNNRIDDLYILDDTGAQNTTFLGNVRVMGQKTTGNSTPVNFSIGGTSPAASLWQSVQNNSLDDAQFAYSPNAGDTDLYTMEAIVNAPTVYGVRLTQLSRQDDATQRIARNVLKAGGTTATGADWYLNQFYTGYSDIWELNPSTGVGFTGAQVNALLAGHKVQV